MRADEYLVEMIKTIKEENEELKKEREDLLQQIDTLSHKNDSNQADDKSVNITEYIGELYELDYLDDYQIKNMIKGNKLTIEDLKQSLIDDDKLLQFYDQEIYYGRKYIAHVNIQKYNYLVHYLDYISALVIYDFLDGMQLECYKIDNKRYFLDYEQAKKVLIEKSRDEIRIALNKLQEEVKQ